MGVTFKFNHYAEPGDVLAENPDCVVVATGGIPCHSILSSGAELATTSWDVLSGAVPTAREVIAVDNSGLHPAMTIAEFVAEQADEMELVTPKRGLAPDIGSTNFPAYMRAMNAPNVKVRLNLQIERLERRGNRIAAVFMDEYRKQEVVKEADVDDLYFALKESSVNRGELDIKAFITGRPQTIATNAEGKFRLFRIGDAVASRNIHAAILDSYRLMIGL